MLCRFDLWEACTVRSFPLSSAIWAQSFWAVESFSKAKLPPKFTKIQRLSCWFFHCHDSGSYALNNITFFLEQCIHLNPALCFTSHQWGNCPEIQQYNQYRATSFCQQLLVSWLYISQLATKHPSNMNFSCLWKENSNVSPALWPTHSCTSIFLKSEFRNTVCLSSKLNNKQCLLDNQPLCWTTVNIFYLTTLIWISGTHTPLQKKTVMTCDWRDFLRWFFLLRIFCKPSLLCPALLTSEFSPKLFSTILPSYQL